MSNGMTPRLAQAFQAAQALPEAEQDVIAAFVLGEIRERRQHAEFMAQAEKLFTELYGEARGGYRSRERLDHDEAHESPPPRDNFTIVRE